MKAIDIKSLMEIRFLSGVSVSPDGTHTAYVETIQNEKGNRYDSRIMLLDNSTGTSIALTNGNKESSFIWDDGNTLLFPACRNDSDKPEDDWAEKTAYYRIDIRGGEARFAFAVDKNAGEIKKIACGKYCYTAVIDLNKPEEKDEDYKDYHVFEEAPFWGNGRGFISRLRSALYIYDEKENKSDKVSSTFFNVDGFDVKDNQVMYFGQEYCDILSKYSEIRAYDVEAGKNTVLVPFGKYGIGSALYTKSGAIVVASTMDKYGAGQLSDFYRLDAEGHMTLAWHSDGTHIGPDVLGDCAFGGGNAIVPKGDEVYFIGLKSYKQEIYLLTADNNVEKLTDMQTNISMLDVCGETVRFVASEKDALNEQYALVGGDVKKLTDANGKFLSEYEVSKAEYIPFTNSEGINIDGWVLKPFGYDPDKKYPGVLEIHGGPRCAYTVGFYHEMQAMAGMGYFVFFCNPRGSEGYGEEFADLRGKYGDIDYSDLMEFTDHVLEVYPQIDPNRLGASGGSYGGFMCNWIEGNTDRFAAIASQRSVSNWVADFGASEIGFSFDENEMGANPWNGMEKMWAQSPLKYACNATTPILFIHSMCDYNCPLDQGLEMFTAMKYFGVPARMCLFEGENHSLSRSGKPRHRIRRLTEIIGWFDKYMK